MSRIVDNGLTTKAVLNRFNSKRAGHYKNQKGISFLSVFFLIFLFLFIGMCVAKIGPSYATNFKIQQVAKDAVSDSALMQKQRSDVVAYLKQAFRHNDIWNSEVGDSMKVKRDRNGGYMIAIEYEERVPLIANIDVVTKFKKDVTQP